MIDSLIAELKLDFCGASTSGISTDRGDRAVDQPVDEMYPACQGRDLSAGTS